MSKTVEEIKKENVKKERKTGRNTGLILVLSGILLFVFFSTNSCSQIRGSGNTVEQGREVSGFDEIELDGFGEIILNQGEREGLVIEAEDNLMEFIETSVSGDRLTIKVGDRRPIMPTRGMKFYITVTELERININGAGSVSADSLTTDSLQFEIDGSSSIEIDELNSDELESNIDGLGSIEVSGRVKTIKIEINGSGTFDGKELQSEEAEIEINGLGSVDVAVSDELDIEINGSGSVSYSGSPNINQDINGLGSVSQTGGR
ncbi:MAG: head GIN domain-containing protein [Chloroflexota bacterium]